MKAYFSATNAKAAPIVGSTMQKENNPYVALNKIKPEEYKGYSHFALYHEVEAIRPSLREGETQELFLFFHFLNLLSKANVDYLLNGSQIIKPYLKDKVRFGKDIDIIAQDPDILFEQIDKAISNATGDITYKIKELRRREADQVYYYDTFLFRIEAYHDGDFFHGFSLDGKVVSDFDKIEKVKYYGPKIIDEDFYYYGVKIESVAAEKIVALSCELLRPYKHLVDVYTLTKYVDLDIGLLKKYLSQILDRENRVREKLNISPINDDYKIKQDKLFSGNYYFYAISAGYRVTKTEMIKEINDWIIKNIES